MPNSRCQKSDRPPAVGPAGSSIVTRAGLGQVDDRHRVRRGRIGREYPQLVLVPKVTAPLWLVLVLTFVGGLITGLLLRRNRGGGQPTR
jgi:hypothetical protein